MQLNLLTANDNFPQGLSLEATGSDSRTVPLTLTDIVTPMSPVLTAQTRNTHNRQLPKRKKTGGRFPVYFLLLLWLLIAATIIRFAGGEENNLISGSNLVIAASGFGLWSLLLASVARRRQAKISHSFGIAGACISAAGLAWLYVSQINIQESIQASIQSTNSTFTPELMTMSFAATCLVFAKLWRTPYLLHLSLFVTIGWTSYVFINASISELIWLFPALWSLQMFLAMNFHIKRSIALSIFTGLYWIGVNLSLLA